MEALWQVGHKFHKGAAALADRHYSMRSVGAPQFMPPGETIVLVRPLGVFGWWRPHPRSGIKAMNGLDGWTCTLFRNESAILSSDLILAAEKQLEGRTCGLDGLITYVFDKKIKSSNPGCCFKSAGWHVSGRSKDGRKTLLQKPFALAGERTSLMSALRRLRSVLDGCFAVDTSASGAGSTPSAGHCAIAARLVQEFFGGELLSTRVEGQSHWFNRISGLDVDLTGDQFGRSPVSAAKAGMLWASARVRSSDELNASTLDRLERLKRRVECAMKETPNDGD